MSELRSILLAERQRYVDFFVSSINSLKDGKETFATELLIEANDKTLIAPFNLVRVDFLSKDEKGEFHVSEIRLDKNMFYDEITVNVNGVNVEICPFCWNSCEVRVDKINVEALKSWITAELKIDQDVEELIKCIHSCSEPHSNEYETEFVIDFGTAEIDVFDRFLSFLSENGSRQVLIQTLYV